MSDDSTLPPTEPVSAVPPTEAMPTTAPAGVGGTPPPGPPGGIVPPPEPWYSNRAALATVIAVGLALLFLLVSWLIWWSSDDDDDAIVIDSSSTTTVVVASTEPDDSTLPTASIVDVDPLPTDSTTTTSTTTTSTTSTTTTSTTSTTVPAPTTTETTVATTAAPTTTSIPVVSVPPSPDATLLDIIEVSPDLSRLAQLIDDAGLGTALSGDEIVTIFAPSNQAIETFESAPGGAELLADPERLAELLLGHVVSGSLDAAEVLTSDSLITVNERTLEVDAEAGTVGGATVVVTDIEAANGILHVVDRVIVTG